MLASFHRDFAGLNWLLCAVAAMSLAALASAQQAPRPDPTLDPTVDPYGEGGALKAQVETGGSYDPYSGNVSRMLKDLDVPGATGSGLDVIRYWNTNAGIEYGFSCDPFGANGWSHSHHWIAVEDYERQYFNDGETRQHEGKQDPVTIEFFRLNIRFPDGRTITARDQRSDQDASGTFGTPARLGSWSVGQRVYDRVVVLSSDAYGVLSFYLHRSDGSTVLFERSSFSGSTGAVHRATKLWDRHGLLTVFEYANPNTPCVTRVCEPAGRFVRFTYNFISNGPPWPLITRIESGRDINSPNDVWQGVDYGYTAGSLAQVTYYNEPATGQSTQAFYTYAGIGLGTADDPHFEGPMNRIRYVYQGSGDFHTSTDVNCNVVNYLASQQSMLYRPKGPFIKEEQNFDGQFTVSRLFLPCAHDTLQHSRRFEQIIGANGAVIGSRMFQYGVVPGPGGMNLGGLQSELSYVTNYTQSAWQGMGGLAVPQPGPYADSQRRVFDFRGYSTSVIFDPLEHPTKATHDVDGSFHTYGYQTPAGTPARDVARIPTPYECWVFSKTDELNFTTTYTRDERRRIRRIDHPAAPSNVATYETFEYNDFNQVTQHRLPSGAVWTFEYDTRGRKNAEWVIPEAGAAIERTEYTYYGPGDHAEWTDRVKDVRNPRAIALGLAYSARMEYNGRGLVTKVHYPATDAVADPTVTYDYDPRGNCIKVTDELGNWKAFDYDEYRRCTTYTEQLNAPDWKATAGVTVASRTWNWDYNRWEASSGWRDWRSHTGHDWRIMFEPAFNAAGDRRATVRYHDIEQRVVGEQSGWLVSGANGAMSYGADAESHYFGYDHNGNKTSFVDPRNRLTTYEFDGRNRPWAVHEPLSRDTYTDYDFAGNKKRVTFPDNRYQQWEQYDAFGQAWLFRDERQNVTNLAFQWGPMKKALTVTTHRTRDGGGTEDQATTFTFDGLGRARKTQFPDGSYEETTYALAAAQTWRNREGIVRTTTYDARGREAYHWWSDNYVTPAVTTTWDAAGRRTGLSSAFGPPGTAPFCALDFGYDAAGQLWWEGSSVAGSGGRVQTTFYRYPNGTVGHVSYPSGFWLRRDWTARGQLKATGWDDAGGNWLVKLAEYAWHWDGKLQAMTHGNGMGSSWDYDDAGRVAGQQVYGGVGGQWFGPDTLVLGTNQTRQVGRYQLVLQGDGNLVLYDLGVFRWATNTAGSGASQLRMQGDGNLVLYPPSGPAVWASNTYSPGAGFSFQADGNLVIYATSGAAVWNSGTGGAFARTPLARTYQRDARDRVWAIQKGTDPWASALENGRGDRFDYDEEGQLTNAYYEAQNPAGSFGGHQREDHFVYDQLGNRMGTGTTLGAGNHLANRGWTAILRRDTGLNEYLQWAAQPIAYDAANGGGGVAGANGVLVQEGSISAAFNALRQPLWIQGPGIPTGQVMFFGHDPLGRCVKRWTGTSGAPASNPATYLYYEDWNLVQEGPAAATVGRYCVHGARVDEVVASYANANQEWHFHHHDARTHCVLLTGNAGSIREQYAYDAFGWPRVYNAAGQELTTSANLQPASAVGNRFLFTGREWLPELRVYDFRNRHYHPELGRFLQPDPRHFEAQDFNLYRYCHNDPINRSDPMGLDDWVWPVAGQIFNNSSSYVIVQGNGGSPYLLLPGERTPASLFPSRNVDADGVWVRGQFYLTTGPVRVDVRDNSVDRVVDYRKPFEGRVPIKPWDGRPETNQPGGTGPGAAGRLDVTKQPTYEEALAGRREFQDGMKSADETSQRLRDTIRLHENIKRELMWGRM